MVPDAINPVEKLEERNVIGTHFLLPIGPFAADVYND